MRLQNCGRSTPFHFPENHAAITPRLLFRVGSRVLGDAMRRRDFISVIAGMAVSWPIASHAQIYPSRPITMVIPFAAGGAFDVMGRILRPV